ncbi:MAG: ABC transporter ATP-binding protein/permease [Clostridia bacterium]|nr:ABC transporter ATP-binding protein/permease [Clostridia bacterium]
MLNLIDVKKDYLSASDTIKALKSVSLRFRESEFVSILGPSGCGKTTLLNIIGGLDHYTSGDLVINGRSTKDFRDSDWDTYRNHSIGFVFQSYNLIPHQSVLANVELALTLSGVSKSERRKKAIAALDKVGLKDQIKKRPNQLSGGQMQRVAIARALVNNPDILLADEPTGALDSVTSIQIMELLKEISKEKLVIMVTHNPGLAEEYSTRIIKLLDGKVVDDTAPVTEEEIRQAEIKKGSRSAVKEKKPSMSLFTALSLSMNNLMTKKGRTILTSFAGSIGIIGIAMILSLSNGINAYIHAVQEETLSSYPIAIQAESVDMTALMISLMGINQKESENAHDLDAVYSSSVMSEMINSLNSAKMQTNNLTLFKKFLEENEEIREYISNIQYSYDLNMQIYTKDENGAIVKSDVEEMMTRIMEGMGFDGSLMGTGSSAQSFGSIPLWQEMLAERDGTGISSLVKDQYDLVYGAWPNEYNEVVLVVNDRNELSDLVLCGLGLISTEEILEEMIASGKGEMLDTAVKSWSYEDICSKKFKIFLPSELYQKNPAGGYTLLTETQNGMEYLFGGDRGVDIRISGIIRQNEDAGSGMLTGALGYTADLTKHLLNKIESNSLIREQLENPDRDVLLNLPFLPEDYVEEADDVKIQKIRDYLNSLSTEQKAEIFIEFSSVPTKEYLDLAVQSAMANLTTRQDIEKMVMDALTSQEQAGTDVSYIMDYIKQLSDDQLREMVRGEIEKQIAEQYAKGIRDSFSRMPTEQVAALLAAKLMPGEQGFTAPELLRLYDDYMPASYSMENSEKILEKLGLTSEDSPSVIQIYTDTFENKETISDLIKKYNKNQEEEDQIEYTDYIALALSGVATIINAISYVLVAFVSISLVVSSIMIGIITYISVLERTKEIGILRAVGASKKDVSRVFNAESVIEGFAAGVMGIGITLLLLIPTNFIIQALTDIPSLKAFLPAGGYLLILVSVLLSFFAGLVPSRFAAKKDPVEALRTE